MPNIIQTRQEYDALADHLNYSGSKALLQSPLHYRAYLEQPREETKALRVGSAVHAFTLTPELAAASYAVAPDVDRRTKDGKDAWSAFTAQNEGKTILTADEWELINRVSQSMSAVIRKTGAHITATELMLSVDYMGIKLKSAIDLVLEDETGVWLYDLKTCEDSSPKGFLAAVRAYRYNLQNVFYRTVYEKAFNTKIAGFRFIATEKTPPTCSATYQIGPELLSYGYEDFIKAVELYKACTALNEWPGYPDEVQVIDINAQATKAPAPISFA
jgi:exodeoxyribonuclease VIII